MNNIQPTLASSLPNLTTLVLTSNSFAELADLDVLRTFQRLTHLSLLENPVTRKEVRLVPDTLSNDESARQANDEGHRSITDIG